MCEDRKESAGLGRLKHVFIDFCHYMHDLHRLFGRTAVTEATQVILELEYEYPYRRMQRCACFSVGIV